MPDGINFDQNKIVNAELYGDVKFNPDKYLIGWSTKAPFYVMVAGLPQAVITRYEDQKAAYEDFARFSSAKRKWPGTEKFNYYRGLPVITDTDPPTQVRLRRLMAPAFSARNLATMETKIADFVATRLEDIAAAGDEFEMIDQLTHPLAAFILLGQCLDLDEEIWPIFIKISKGMASFNALAAGEQPPKSYLDAWENGYNYCAQLIQDRRRHPKDDVLGKIVAAGDDEGKVSTEEMFATMLVLFTAGFGGIKNTPAFTLWRLCRDRTQFEMLRDDLSMVNAAVSESVRLDTNAWSNIRWATQDFEFGGLKFFAGMPIHLMCSAPNYNPALFDDPLRFDITRKPQDLVSFGHGFHHCIGSLLVKMSTRIVVKQIIEKFPNLHLADPAFQPQIIGGPKERGIHALPLQIA